MTQSNHRMGWPAALNCIPLEPRESHVTPPRSIGRDGSDYEFEEQDNDLVAYLGDWYSITEADCRQVKQSINGAAEVPIGQDTSADTAAKPPHQSTTDKPQVVLVKTSMRKPPKPGRYPSSYYEGGVVTPMRLWNGECWCAKEDDVPLGVSENENVWWLDTSTPAIGEDGALLVG